MSILLKPWVKTSRAKIKEVRVDGGAAANNLLMQMQSDFLGASVIRPKLIETTSLGAGFVAGIGVGIWSSKNALVGLDKVDKRFKPKYSASQRNERVKEWRQAIAGLSNIYN